MRSHAHRLQSGALSYLGHAEQSELDIRLGALSWVLKDPWPVLAHGVGHHGTPTLHPHAAQLPPALTASLPPAHSSVSTLQLRNPHPVQVVGATVPPSAAHTG
jgi:hypothetical protein